jgi:hypothetical protein
MSFGTLLWYMVAWQQILRQWSTLSFAIGWIPFGIFGTLGAFFAAWLPPPSRCSMDPSYRGSKCAYFKSALSYYARKQTYWAQVFPATILTAFCLDFVYTAAQIIASNSVRRSQQGVAASLIGTLNLYVNSLGLGLAGTVEPEVNKGTVRPVHGYRAALYFGVGIAAVALMVDVLFVRMKRDEREGWEEEADRLEEFESEAVSTAVQLQNQRPVEGSRQSAKIETNV